MVSQNPDRQAVHTNEDTAANNNNFFGEIVEKTGRFAGQISAVLEAANLAKAKAKVKLKNTTGAVLLNPITGSEEFVASDKVEVRLAENKNLTVVAHVYPDGKRAPVNVQPANNAVHYGTNPNTQKVAPVVVNVSSYEQPNGQSPANTQNYDRRQAA